MFTASGLRVRFLKVIGIVLILLKCLIKEFGVYLPYHLAQVWEKSGYNTVEWVRYITKAGSYEIRC